MVLDPIPQSLPVHFFGSRPQPPTSPYMFEAELVASHLDLTFMCRSLFISMGLFCRSLFICICLFGQLYMKLSPFPQISISGTPNGSKETYIYGKRRTKTTYRYEKRPTKYRSLSTSIGFFCRSFYTYMDIF